MKEGASSNIRQQVQQEEDRVGLHFPLWPKLLELMDQFLILSELQMGLLWRQFSNRERVHVLPHRPLFMWNVTKGSLVLLT